MYATKEDLKNAIYSYQAGQITEDDDSIILHALAAAEQEARSYLELNDKLEHLDGRPHYDTEKIFSARGSERNPLILNIVITIAKWYIINLSNVDTINEQAQERYNQAIEYLKQLSKGEVTISSLPLIEKDNTNPQSGALAFRFGSRAKFNHE